HASPTSGKPSPQTSSVQSERQPSLPKAFPSSQASLPWRMPSPQSPPPPPGLESEHDESPRAKRRTKAKRVMTETPRASCFREDLMGDRIVAIPLGAADRRGLETRLASPL